MKEVRRTVRGWNSEPSLGKWNQEERGMVEGIGRILEDNIPVRRYSGSLEVN